MVVLHRELIAIERRAAEEAQQFAQVFRVVRNVTVAAQCVVESAVARVTSRSALEPRRLWPPAD